MPLVSPSLQEMDQFEKEETKKSRSLVKNKLNEWYDCWLIIYQNQSKIPQIKNF